MSKTWKWILGVAAILVLVGALSAIGYFWRSRADAPVYVMHGTWERSFPPTFDQRWDGPDAHGRGRSHPMAGGYSPHFSGFFLLGGLLKFALFLGLLYGAYWLGRRNARIALDPAPGAPASSPPAPAADPAPALPESDSPPAPRKRARKASDK